MAAAVPTLSQPAQFQWLKAVLALTLLLNLFDLCATLFFVNAGLATEANPVMATALTEGSLPFALLKLGLVSAGIAVLWRFRERPLAAVGALTTLAAYLAVGVYHGHMLRVVFADVGADSLLALG